SRGLLIVDQRAAFAQDLVVVIGRNRGHAGRGVHGRNSAAVGPGRMQPGHDERGEYKQQDFQAGAHRASDMGQHGTCYHGRGGFCRKDWYPPTYNRYFTFSILRTRNIIEPLEASPDPTLMTTMIDDRVRAAVASPARNFYFHMALACAAVAFLGFAPTYWVPLAQDLFGKSGGPLPRFPVLHLDRVLRASKLACGIRPHRPASLARDRRRVACDRDDHLRLPGVGACDAAFGSTRADRGRHRLLDRALQRHRRSSPWCFASPSPMCGGPRPTSD